MTCCTAICNYFASYKARNIAISAVISSALLIIGSLSMGGMLPGLPLDVGYFFVASGSVGLFINFISLLAKGCGSKPKVRIRQQQ
jgi:hypothetical protein